MRRLAAVVGAAGVILAVPAVATAATPHLAAGHSYYLTNKTNGGRLWYNQNTGTYQTKTVASGHYTVFYVTPSGAAQEFQDGFGLACMQVNAGAGTVVNSSFQQCSGSITQDPPSVLWGVVANSGYYFLDNVYSNNHDTCSSGNYLELSGLGMNTGVSVNMTCTSSGAPGSNQLWTVTEVS